MGWDRDRVVEALESVAGDRDWPAAARVSALTTIDRILGFMQDRRTVTGEVEYKHRLVPGQGPLGELSAQERRTLLVMESPKPSRAGRWR